MSAIPQVPKADLVAARNGAIYEGRLRHRRTGPKRHRFEYPLFMLWLDLDRLEGLFRGLRWASTKRFAPIRYRREDYFGDPERPLADCVRDVVEQKVGRRPEGPIRILTHLRTWGYAFNPVSFYYCFTPDESSLEAIVAEVHNTPWDERYCYVLDNPQDNRRGIRSYGLRKAFHVSPFMPMDIDYTWNFSHPLTPGDDGHSLFVHMVNEREGGRVFDATLRLERSAALSDRALRSVLLRHPLLPIRIMLWIYGHAAVLWLKKTPFFSHPNDDVSAKDVTVGSDA
ncbi:MAG: DUF1365 domain-containing protein [Acidobacteriota bacterium]